MPVSDWSRIVSQLVIHVPHASTTIPPDVREQFTLSASALAAEARLSADLLTDELARAAWPSATIVAAEVSRLVIDVERYADDRDEPMAAVGRGMIYARTRSGRPLRRDLTAGERAALQAAWYDPHWQRLRAAATGRIMIDLHSYPKRAWKVEPHPQARRPEIDLGTTSGLTPDSWVAALQSHFAASGYDVGLNTPYAGVVDAGAAAAAVMIEIRRDLIGALPHGPGWERLRTCLSQLPMP